MSPLTVLAYAGVAFAIVVGLLVIGVVIGSARITLARQRADSRGGMLELDRPEARDAIGQRR